MPNLLGVRPSFATGFAQSPGESEYPELWRGLVGVWDPSLGQTGGRLIDWSGNGNHGVLVNDTHWVLGPNGWVLSFDGTGDKVVIPGVPAFGTADFSVCIWVQVLGQTDTNPEIIGHVGSPAAGWSFFVFDAATESAHLRFLGDGTAIDAEAGLSTFPNDPTRWVFCVAVRRSGVLTVYQDGIVVATDNTATADLTSTADIELSNATSWEFKGLLDLPMVYNRALIPAEISLLHQLRKQVA